MGISPNEKQQVVELMITGTPWTEATQQVGVSASQSTAYRWVREWRQEGAAGLSDGRHGHAHKVTPEIRAWIKESCGQAPHTPSSKVKKMIEAKFEVEISRGHLNRVRAELGVSRPKKSRT
jgi:transposase